MWCTGECGTASHRGGVLGEFYISGWWCWFYLAALSSLSLGSSSALPYLMGLFVPHKPWFVAVYGSHYFRERCVSCLLKWL